jgi:hypothetical protein
VTPSPPLDINSLARRDSHMMARFLNIWNEASTQRGTWPTPFDDDFDIREIETDKHYRATLVLGQFAGTWVRHLLAEAGVKKGDLPPPTSSQQRKLLRLLDEHGRSEDRGLTLLTTWARWTLSGQHDRLQGDLERLAGDMQVDILASVVDHVRRTSAEYDGQPIPFRSPAEEALEAKLSKLLGDAGE